MGPDILALFAGKPQALELYEKLEAQMLGQFPEVRVKVTKTQVSFSNRYIFALASPPRRKKDDHLVVSFGLGYEKRSPRIFCAVEAVRGRWTHHVAVKTVQELDDELFRWIQEAFEFAAVK